MIIEENLLSYIQIKSYIQTLRRVWSVDLFGKDKHPKKGGKVSVSNTSTILDVERDETSQYAD